MLVCETVFKKQLFCDYFFEQRQQFLINLIFCNISLGDSFQRQLVANWRRQKFTFPAWFWYVIICNIKYKKGLLSMLIISLWKTCFIVNYTIYCEIHMLLWIFNIRTSCLLLQFIVFIFRTGFVYVNHFLFFVKFLNILLKIPVNNVQQGNKSFIKRS